MIHFPFPSVCLPGDLGTPDHVLGLYVVIPWRESNFQGSGVLLGMSASTPRWQ